VPATVEHGAHVAELSAQRRHQIDVTHERHESTRDEDGAAQGHSLGARPERAKPDAADDRGYVRVEVG
jgi:hypothetical protein